MSDLLNYILSHEDAFRKNRLPSLYSDFVVQKKTNPDGYAVNVAAWEKALTNAAWAGYVNSGTTTGNKRDHLVLTADENLLHSLQLSGWGKPVALASVFDEAIQTQTMIPWEVYTSPNFSLAAGRWKAYQPGVMSPWHVMNWGLRQLKGLVVGTDNASAQLQSQKLVLINNLKETAKLALHLQNSRYTSALDHIYSKERFKLIFRTILDNNTELSDTDIDALLTYLSRDSKAISYDGKTIKFLTDNDKSAVTSQDATIASIKDLISNLTREVSRLEQKIDELNDNAKAALAKKNRISALSAVKKRKIAEHNLTQRINTLHQLEEVDSKIEQSVGQIEIVRVMQASTGVLRSLNAKMGGVETVEEVVENLREEMSKVDEIGTIMNETTPVIDEGEIDEELAALETTQVREREDEEAQATKHKLQLLEDHERAAREETRGKIISKEAANDVESDLAASIGQLSNMSLKDTSTATAKLDEQEATEPTPAQ